MTALAALVRVALFGGVLLLVGAGVFSAVVVPAVRKRLDAETVTAMDRSAASWGVAAALTFALAVVGSLAAQYAAFRDPFDPGPQLGILLDETSWGTWWKVQAAVALAAALVAAARTRTRGPFWSRAALVTALAAAATPAFSGHSFGSERLTGLAIAADAIHVVTAGAWLGTLAVIVLAVGPRLPRIGASGLAAVVSAFSPVALASAGLVVATGVFATWLHTDFGPLWSHAYGRILLAKLVLVALVAAAGAYNWRVATRRLEGGEGGDAFLRRSARGELLAGAVVVVLTAFLVATTPAAM